jgi:foldase protein PrsA
MKQYRWAAALALALVTTAGAAPAPKVNPNNDVVAMVGDEPITREALVKRLLAYYGDTALDAMINQTIVRQVAQRQKITVTDAEVDRRVLQVKGMFRTPEMYLQMLRESGMTEPQHREQVRFTMLSEKIVAKVDPVTDADLELARARVIVVGTDEEAKTLVKQLKGGVDFVQTARQKSLDKRTGQAGGDLGYFLRVDLPDVWKVIANMKPGDVTGPAKLGTSIVVLKLEERRPASQLTPPERERYTTRILNYKIGEWLDRSRRQTKVTRPVPLNLPEARRTTESTQEIRSP